MDHQEFCFFSMRDCTEEVQGPRCGVGLHCTWEDLLNTLNTQVDQKDLRLPTCCQQVYKYMIFDPPSGGLANQKEWVAQSRNWTILGIVALRELVSNSRNVQRQSSNLIQLCLDFPRKCHRPARTCQDSPAGHIHFAKLPGMWEKTLTVPWS